MTHHPAPSRAHWLACMVASCVSVTSAWAAPDAAPLPATSTQISYVIPPAQEGLISAMLDPGKSAPGVVMAGAKVEQTRIRVDYSDAEQAKWLLWLGHPEAAPPAQGGPWRTEVIGPFALHESKGSASPAWRDKLLKRLRTSLADVGGAWKWQKIKGDGRGQKGQKSKKSGDEGAAQAAADALLKARHAAMAGDPGDTRSRLAKAEAALKRLPAKEHQAWHHLEAALVCRAAGDAAAADQHGQEALRLAGDGPRHKGLRARVLIAQARYDQLAGALPGTEAGPDCSSALAVEDLRLVGQPKLGTALARKIVANNPRCARAYIAAAQIARRAGTMATIEDLLQAGAKALPKDGAVLVQLANLRMQQSRPKDALALLDRAARTDNLDASFLVDISHVYTTIEPPDEDVNRWLKRAADDKDYAANFIVGVLLHYRYRWAESDRHLARAEPGYGNETRLLIYRAMNRHRLGDRDAALKLIERASSGARPDPDVLYCRGVIGLDVDTDRAIKDLETYLAQTRESHEVYLPKQQRVERMLADLRDCRDAKVPSECLQTRKTLRKAKPWGAAVAALLGILLVVFLLRRRRGAAALLALGPILLWSEQAVAAHPRTIIAQWSWLGELDRVQVGIAAVLWLVALGFFFAAWRRFSRAGQRWHRWSVARR